METNLGFLLRFPHRQRTMFWLPLIYSKLLVSGFASKDACDMTFRQPRSSFSLNNSANSSSVLIHHTDNNSLIIVIVQGKMYNLKYLPGSLNTALFCQALIRMWAYRKPPASKNCA